MKPRTNDINQCMNNSSAVVAPSRSEIRIQVTLPVINFRKILSKALNVVIASSTVRISAIVSACALSCICLLKLPASVPLVMFLGVMCVVTSLFTFWGILNEMGGFRGMMNDIMKED